MPKLCPLYSPGARPARFCLKAPMMKFTALKRAGQGWEENVVLIQLWSTTCVFFKRTEKNINSDAKANFQMAHQKSFLVIHFVNITRQIHSVNIYTIQYINHREIKRKPPCNSFLSVFLFFHSKEDCLKSRENFVVHETYFSFAKNAVTCKKEPQVTRKRQYGEKMTIHTSTCRNLEKSHKI